MSASPRKVPPPCWAYDETCSLIEAYRVRWLALGRGYLRSADWDAVAAASATSKSSAQCRHKIEKLRQRYRAEKQRVFAFPGKYVPSWAFFQMLEEFIGDGSSGSTGSAARFGAKMKVGASLSKDERNVGSSNFEGNFERSVDLENGILVPFRGIQSNDYDKLKQKEGGLDRSDYNELDEDGLVHERRTCDQNSVPPGFRLNKCSKFNDDSDRNTGPDVNGGTETGDGIFERKFRCSNRSPTPSRFKSTSLNKNGGKSIPNLDVDCEADDVDGGGGFKPQNYRDVDGNSNSAFDSSLLNGRSSSCREKRRMDPMVDLVASIKLLADGFVKMETMKMEMVRDMEKLRVEMEMKRNEIVLESQRQIADAFLSLILEKGKKKVKIMANPDPDS